MAATAIWNLHAVTGYNQDAMDDAPATSAEVAAPLAAAVRYDTWAIASKLGANKADDYRDQAARHQVTLTNHRWRWFASRPREWREELEVIVNLTLLQHLEEHSPGADEDTVQRLKDAVHDALWQDRGSLAVLKERAVHLHNAGEDECRKKCAARTLHHRLTSHRLTSHRLTPSTPRVPATNTVRPSRASGSSTSSWRKSYTKS